MSDMCHPLPTYHVYIEVRIKCLSSWYLLCYFLCSFVQYILNMPRVLTFLVLSSAISNFLKLHGTAYLSCCCCCCCCFFFCGGFKHWSVLHVLFTFRQSRNYGVITLKHFVFYGQTTCSENVTFTCIMNRTDRSNITAFSCRQ